MVHVFAVANLRSSGVPLVKMLGREILCEREPSNPRDTIALAEQSPSGNMTVGSLV